MGGTWLCALGLNKDATGHDQSVIRVKTATARPASSDQDNRSDRAVLKLAAREMV
jgi:hypothetical protein